MKAKEWEVAKKLQEQIDKKHLLYCPACDEFDPGPPRQPLCAIGDSENLLFCPHCDLVVHLIVDIFGHTEELYGEREED